LLSFQFQIAFPKRKLTQWSFFGSTLEWLVPNAQSICFVTYFYEGEHKKTLFIFHWTNNLHNNKFNQFIVLKNFFPQEDEKTFFHNSVHGFTSKDFWITSNYSIQNQGCANLEFFFMVFKNNDPYRSKIMVENKLGTHNSSSLNFKAIRTTKLNNKPCLKFWL